MGVDGKGLAEFDVRAEQREVSGGAATGASEMNQDELQDAIERQAARLAKRPAEQAVCEHTWASAYKSSSGRRVCAKCGIVTDKPFETLGVGES